MADRTYAAIEACCVAMTRGHILHADNVTAGNGQVIDWRKIRCGDLVQDRSDTFDTARAFVRLVGHHAAFSAAVDAMHPDEPGSEALDATSTGEVQS